MTLKKDMQDVTKALKGLIQKVEKMQKQADKGGAPKAKKAAPVKKTSAKKTTGKKTDTAIATAFAIIGRSKKGVDTTTLMQKTRYNKKKVANLVFKLKQQGKIKSVGKGIYTKA